MQIARYGSMEYHRNYFAEIGFIDEAMALEAGTKTTSVLSPFFLRNAAKLLLGGSFAAIVLSRPTRAGIATGDL